MINLSTYKRYREEIKNLKAKDKLTSDEYAELEQKATEIVWFEYNNREWCSLPSS
jgi:hypothetical protein